MARSAETKTQLIRRARLKRKERAQGLEGPYFGIVREYNHESDTTLIDSHAGRRVIKNPQPHLGQQAWLRAGPDSGMGALLNIRSDSEEPEILRWWHTDTQSRLALYRASVANLAKGTGTILSTEAFRPVKSGEVDFASIGGCSFYMGSRPHIDMRAGIITQTMDQDEGHYTTKAPLHIRRGFQNKENKISDEERLGVVQRAKAGSFVHSFFPNIEGEEVSAKGTFTKEHLLRLTNSQAVAPEILLDEREGHVMDDEGKPVTLTETGLNLRYKKDLFTPNETKIVHEVDEDGNFKIEHPEDATYGGLFRLPAGSMHIEIGRDCDTFVGHNNVETIATDNRVVVGHDDNKIVIHGKKLRVQQDYVVVVNNDDKSKTARNKIIQTETLSILATKEIIFEAPKITFNTPEANFTGKIRTEGFASNSGIVAPNLQRRDYSGTKGTAGHIEKKEALTVDDT